LDIKEQVSVWSHILTIEEFAVSMLSSWRIFFCHNQVCSLFSTCVFVSSTVGL
jgi:hypothetical protein